jgi:hypothetical protein
MRSLGHIWLLLAFVGFGFFVAETVVSLTVDQELPQVVAGDLLPEDQAGLRAYAIGLQSLNENRLEEALNSFETTRKATTPVLVSAGSKAADRAQFMLALPARLRGPVFWFAEQTFAVRWLATSLAFLTGLVCMSLWLRRFGLLAGCEVGRFTVLAAESLIDNAAIERLLRDRLEHIGFCLQRPAGVGGAIGPALAVDSLLPSGNPASPLKDALAGLDEIATKGGMPFAIGQVERVLGLLRRRRRYRITGAVQVSGAEARALVDLTDLRTRSALAHVSASSIEMDRRYGSSWRTSSATPLDLMSGALEISAYKIWHALAEATQPGLKPLSWATLAQFVSGLDALAEAETHSHYFGSLAESEEKSITSQKG